MSMQVMEHKARRLLMNAGRPISAAAPTSGLPRSLAQLVRQITAADKSLLPDADQILLAKMKNALKQDDGIEVVPNDEENGMERDDGVVENTARETTEYLEESSLNGSHAGGTILAEKKKPKPGKDKPKEKEKEKPKKPKKVLEADDEEDGVVEEPVKKGKKPSLKPPKAKNKGREGTIPKDKYGFKVTTIAGKANAVLTRVPKTMKEIIEAAGLTNTVYEHMKKMIELGFVERDGKTFRLAKK